MCEYFPLNPQSVPSIDTEFRRIVTELPVPASIEILKRSREYEPNSLRGQPPLIWDHASGVQVYDPYGNMWLDWSSGVLVSNTGHGHPAVLEAIRKTVGRPNLFSYCFPSEERIEFAEKVVKQLPDGLDKVFFLSTGSETIENAIKLARTNGEARGGKEKKTIISFRLGFHGRTLGSQQAGGDPNAKTWIGWLDPGFVQVPFPDGFRCRDTSFDLFLSSLDEQNVDPENVAGVVIEAYQGGGASFAPTKYMQALAAWCRNHDILLIFDEVQSGFGRTGKMFGFEHYGVLPDLLCFGKAITSSLPLSAVVGSREVMDQYGPGSMTSTHGGNPIACAAGIASLDTILENDLVANAAKIGGQMYSGLLELQKDYPEQIGAVHGRGLVYGVHVVRAGTDEPDTDLAHSVVRGCFERGLLMFAPVGYGSGTVKICPPLVITAEQVLDGLAVLQESIGTALNY